MTLEQTIEQALRTSLANRAQSQFGTIALVEAGNPARVNGYFYLTDVARDIAAAVQAKAVIKTDISYE